MSMQLSLALTTGYCQLPASIFGNKEEQQRNKSFSRDSSPIHSMRKADSMDDNNNVISSWVMDAVDIAKDFLKYRNYVTECAIKLRPISKVDRLALNFICHYHLCPLLMAVIFYRKPTINHNWNKKYQRNEAKRESYDCEEHVSCDANKKPRCLIITKIKVNVAGEPSPAPASSGSYDPGPDCRIG
ncbi:hypothetical protein BDC45DRAFT_557943 [Circinella umbellata]|nr:hypothetical protein BDC45DRAFT_557943 [Circinella umbellata]